MKAYSIPVVLTFKTTRSVEVEADSPEEAAQKAVEMGVLNERYWKREVLSGDEAYVETEIQHDEIKEEKNEV